MTADPVTAEERAAAEALCRGDDTMLHHDRTDDFPCSDCKAKVSILAAADLLRQPDDTAAALCSQCGEMPSVMVKVGTSDGWCEGCLYAAATINESWLTVLLAVADEMEAVIADGDSAECAAPVEGEVGRSAVVDRRDRLYEEPHEWLREYVAALAPAATEGQGDE